MSVMFTLQYIHWQHSTTYLILYKNMTSPFTKWGKMHKNFKAYVLARFLQ